MGKSTISMAIFNSYFDITRVYQDVDILMISVGNLMLQPTLIVVAMARRRCQRVHRVSPRRKNLAVGKSSMVFHGDSM